MNLFWPETGVCTNTISGISFGLRLLTVLLVVPAATAAAATVQRAEIQDADWSNLTLWYDEPDGLISLLGCCQW